MGDPAWRVENHRVSMTAGMPAERKRRIRRHVSFRNEV
jgi:hypothetical protein